MMFIMRKNNHIANQVLSSAQVKFQRIQANLTKVMIIVCLCFIICWGPVLIHYLLMFQGLVPGLKLEGLRYQIVSYMSFANSCINPFVYAFKYEDFKKGTRRLLGFHRKTEPTVQSVSTASTL